MFVCKQHFKVVAELILASISQSSSLIHDNPDSFKDYQMFLS